MGSPPAECGPRPVRSVFAVVPLSEVPHPESLGRDRYPALHAQMMQYFGTYAPGSDAIRDAFDDAAFTAMLRAELEPAFCNPPIDQVAAAARDLAQNSASGWLNRALDSDGERQYRAAILDQGRNQAERHVLEWAVNPPRIESRSIGDGSHRLTALRLTVPADYPVLVWRLDE